MGGYGAAGKSAGEEPRGAVGRAKTEKAARSGQPFHHPRYIELRDRASLRFSRRRSRTAVCYRLGLSPGAVKRGTFFSSFLEPSVFPFFAGLADFMIFFLRERLVLLPS